VQALYISVKQRHRDAVYIGIVC